MKIKRCALVAAVVPAVCTVAFWCRNQSVSEVGSVAGTSVAPIRTATSAAPASVAALAAPVAEPASNQTATVRGTKPYVLTCEGGFDKPLRLAAEASGVRTVGVLSAKTLLVEADAAALARIRADRRFVVEDEFRPSKKIESALAAQIAGGATVVDVSFVTLSPSDRKVVQNRIVARGGEILGGCLNTEDTFSARLPAALVAELASCGDVRWMEQFVRPQLMNDVAVNAEAMNVRSVWDAHGLSGANQIVSTSDSGIDTGDLETLHEDLRDRILDMKAAEGCDLFDSNGHGTHTAGSIVGNGSNSVDRAEGQIRGTAWGAQLCVWFCAKGGTRSVYHPEDCAELFRGDKEGAAWGAYIHSASWGSDTAGKYTELCAKFDEYLWKHPDFLPVVSAGNAGSSGKDDERTVGSPAAAKNVLAVGATLNVSKGDPSETASFSSRGPCMDGRIKPDVAAPGDAVLSTRSSRTEGEGPYTSMNGTSMSCPLAAGSVALVREWLVDRKGFGDPSAALMKAVVTGGARGAAKPNSDQGWGRVDLAETLFPSNRAVKLIDSIPFAAKEEFTWLVTTTNDAPLDVQLAWIDAPALSGVSEALPRLVNDLDLTVRPYGDETVLYRGNGGNEADALNNLESVRLSGSGTGTNAYLVTVSCSRVLYDHEDGGAAALYIRGAFDPDEIREYATVRIGSRGFVNLDRALAAARDKEIFPDPVRIEILDVTALKEQQTIDFDCTIVATNLDAHASAVTRRGDAALNVATNGFLSLGNVVFAGSSATAVDVASNGVVAVSGLVDFGVPYDVAAIRTAASDGFMLAGTLVRGFTLDCAAAMDVEEPFGFGRALSDPVFEGITNTADLIANAYDPRGEMRGYVVGGPDDYTLVWRRRPVPFAESVGYFVDADGKTNTAARIDGLVEAYRKARDAGRLGAVRRIVLRRSGTLSQPLSVGEDLALAGEDGVGLSVEPSAGFVLTSGTLEVTGIAFSNYTGNALFLVNGSSAKLKIGAGTAFTDVRGTNAWSGAVTVLAGSATVGGGARFERCGTRTSGNAFGGAIYLASGCALSLEGCTIAGCQARTHGGAVYADAGSLVSVSNLLSIDGNTVSDKEEDIYLKGDARLLLTGSVSGSVGIRRSVTGGNAAEFRFAEAEEALYAHASKEAFFCTANPDVVAKPVDSPTAGLVWTDRPAGPQPWTGDPSKANARVNYPGRGPINYLLVSEALESLTGDATVEIVGTNAAGRVLAADVEIDHVVTLSATNANLTLDRQGDCSIRVVAGGTLTLKDVTVCGSSGSARTSVPLFDVCGGSLVLATPSVGRVTEVSRVYGDFRRNAGAVSVWQGGTFRIESGALIRDCTNGYRDDGSGAGRGGAVLVDNGRAELFGGTITNCCANHGGGVFIGNEATVEVKGDMVVAGNCRLDGATPSNLYVHDQGRMLLTGKLTGHVGYTEGVAADTNVFGRIASSVAPADRQTSAHNFTHDTNGDIGLAVAGGTENLLVWGSSLAADGTYVDKDGRTYRLPVGNEAKIDVPEAIGGLVYDGTAKTGVEGIDCLITGNVATNAGDYVARATPRPGFVWTDGSTVTMNIGWSIAKATNDVSGVSFTDVTYVYDGKSHSIAVEGEVPSGVEVVYAGDPTNRTEVGTNVVTVSFNVLDTVNYAAITNTLTAKLIIEENPYAPVDPPLPPETNPFTVETNTPTPIAFSEIRRLSDSEWRLVVTDLVEQAEYAVSHATDLKTFTTGTWVRATSSGAWTNDVSGLEAKPTYFWRAHGRTTYVTNWLNAVQSQP